MQWYLHTSPRVYINETLTYVIITVFGPNDNYGQNSHVIPGLIRRMHEIMKADDGIPQKDKVFEVFGSGRPLRQFIYSLDLAKLILWVLNNWDKPEPIILSVDETNEVSIAQAANAVAKSFKFEGKLVYNTSKADGQFKKTASNAKIRSLLPDFEFTDFEQAIQESIDWYLQNLDKARK